MSYNRRAFLTLGAGSVATGFLGTMPLAYGDTKTTIKAIAFDAFTTFDPQPIVALAEQLFPTQGAALGNAWRARQFEYTWLRSVGHRYVDFWNSMIKFFVLAVLLRQVVAASSDPAPDSALAPPFFGRPSGQLP